MDDQELLRLGLRIKLESDLNFTVVGEAGTAPEALAGIGTLQPDVAVVDVKVGEASGIEICREIRSRHSAVRCLVLSACCDVRDVSAAFLAGVSGYILKQRSGKDVVEAVREVAAGRLVLDPVLTNIPIRELRAGVRPDPLLVNLSRLDGQILELIARGLTNRQIGDRLFLAEKTVRNHVSQVLASLGMHRRSEAAAYAARLVQRGELGSFGPETS